MAAFVINFSPRILINFPSELMKTRIIQRVCVRRRREISPGVCWKSSQGVDCLRRKFQFITHFSSSYTKPFTAIFRNDRKKDEKKLGERDASWEVKNQIYIPACRRWCGKVSQSRLKWAEAAACRGFAGTHEKCMRSSCQGLLNCSWKFVFVQLQIRFGSSVVWTQHRPRPPRPKPEAYIFYHVAQKRFNHRSHAWTWRCVLIW